MEFRSVTVDGTELPPRPEDQELTIRLRLNHIYQGVFRHLEGRETILNQQLMFPTARTLFNLPINLLSQPSAARHHIICKLSAFGLDDGLADDMTTQILSRCQTTSTNQFSFHADVVWTDVLFDEGELGGRIPNFDEIVAYYRSNLGLDDSDFDFGGGDRLSSANNGVSTSLLEKLRAERRVDGTSTNGSIEGPCAICLDDFLMAKELIDMPCRHVFHESCIFSWLKTNDSCPLCRRRVEL